MEENRFTVDVIIPVYNPDERFRKLLNLLNEQTYPVNKIIVMNTEARYWNPMLERHFDKVEVHHLTKNEFDHGATRCEGASYSDADILVFMTQDALPEDDTLIENLTEAFTDSFAAKLKAKGRLNPVAAAFARQLPDSKCNVIEKYTRSFNYPEESRVKTIADIDELGIKTFFLSNVCAAYRREYFESLGGFIKHTIFNEDMIFAGHAVKAGFAICYQANARVIHSHNYSCMQQFHRNFDLAVSQADNPDVFEGIKSESEGIKLVKRTAGYLFSIKKPWLIFELVLKSGFKYLGYKMGRMYKKLPKKIVLACTMNKEYWK